METSFCKTILDNIINAVNRFPIRPAFCINEEHFTYSQFGQCISKIRAELKKTDYRNTKVGLVTNDDLDTYASIIALWVEGDCYVPLHPNWPLERCLDICEQVELDLILDSSETSRYENNYVLNTTKLEYTIDCLEPKEDVSDDDLAYILFTSGSTGKPKGVMMMRRNVAAFMDSLEDWY
jgi:long-subunit acyl-CoA synthetase (AMP-forming)